MSFISFKFPALLAIAVYIYYQLPSRYRTVYLLVLSYLFYLTWSVKYAVLLAGITVLAYLSAIKIEEDESEGHPWEILKYSILAGMFLILFKVAGPLLEAFNRFFPDSKIKIPHAEVLIPLGLSYYTFKVIGYLIDVYSRKIKAERDLVRFAGYVSFFPQIVSGPIQSAADYFRQIGHLDGIPSERIAGGLRLILFGLFKKIVVADTLRIGVDQAYSNIGQTDGFIYFMTVYFYAFQLYADFSGFTDIAVGIGRLFGIESPANFRNPFYAASLPEFWRRWHITLTSWLSAYIFTPLNIKLRRLGTLGLCIAIMSNMILIGLWHGLTWNFMIFGILHGVWLMGSILTKASRDRFFEPFQSLRAWRELAAPLITFHAVALSFVFLRVPTFAQAVYVLRCYFASLSLMLRELNPRIVAQYMYYEYCNSKPAVFAAIVFGILTMEIIHLIKEHPFLKSKFFQMPVWFRWGAYYALLLSLIFLGQYNSYTFIYEGF